MSQDTGLFSVRRPREVNIPVFIVLQYTETYLADIGWYQLQLRHSSACFRIKALQFHLQYQREPCTSHIPPCALSLLFANVACSEPASAAKLPAHLIREQLQYLGGCADEPTIYGPAKLFFQHFCWRVCKQNELCARCDDASEPAIFKCFSKLAAKKQHILSTVLHGANGPSVILHTGSSSSKRTGRLTTVERSQLQNESGARLTRLPYSE